MTAAPSRTAGEPSVGYGWPAHASGICALAWSPDGRRLVTGGNDGLVRYWDSGSRPGEPLETMAAHEGSVRALAWSPDGRWLASGAEDGVVLLSDVAGDGRVGVVQTGRRWVNAVAWSPDGALLAAAGGDRLTVVTDRAGRPVHPPLRSPYGVFLSLAWSPDGRTLAATGRGPAVTLWDTADWSVRAVLDAGPGAVWTACWLPDGGGLVTGNAAGLVRVWDVAARRVRTAVAAHGGVVARVTPARGGDVLVTLSHDQTVAAWETASGRLLWRLPDAYPGWTGCLEASPAGDLVAGTDATGREVRVRPVTRPARDGDAGASPPVPRSVRADVAAARRAGRGWVGAAALRDALAARCPELRKPEGWVEAALTQLEAEGEVFVPGSRDLAALDPAALAEAARLVVEGPGGSDGSTGLVRPADALGRVLARRPGLGAGWEASPGLLPATVGALLVRGGRGWVADSAVPTSLFVPAGAGPDASRVMADVLATTLFRRYAVVGRTLLLRDAADRPTSVTVEDDGAGRPPAVTIATADPYRSDVLARFLAARTTRCRAGAPMPEPAGAAWRAWDPAAAGGWAWDWADLPADPADAAAELDEHADDEALRQERVLLRAAAPPDAPPDAAVWHLAADTATAEATAADLELLGLRTWCAGAAADPARLAEQALRARVAVLVVSPALTRWTATPLAAAYDDVTLRSAAVGRRVRWIPLAVSGSERKSAPGDLPDHLHSFDWYRRGDDRDTDPAVRRRELQALLGGVLVDRARS